MCGTFFGGQHSDTIPPKAKILHAKQAKVIETTNKSIMYTVRVIDVDLGDILSATYDLPTYAWRL